MNNNPVAVVLAGGAGKRWWPLTTNKILFPFIKQSVIHSVLEQLSLAGIAEVVFVANPNDAEIVSQLKIAGVTSSVVVQKESKGMGDAILSAKDVIRGRSMLVVNADDLVENKLYESLKTQIQKNAPFVVGRKVSSYVDIGYLKVKDEKLIEIIEKPGEGNEPSNLTELVFHFFPQSDDLIQILDKTTSNRDDVYEQAHTNYVKQYDTKIIRYDGYWASLKYPWHVLDIMDFILSHLKDRKNVEIRKNVHIEGTVVFGDNVKIFENTKIVGPCWIGDNTIIGNNNIIRESHIGANCVTGFNTDITRSYIGDNCWFHSNYIGDSVLEENISLGSGTVLANLRLDERDIYSVVKGERVNTKRNKLGAMIAKNVHVGVNASIMPGVKIGTNSFVGAGLVIDHDIPENSFCYGKTELVIKSNEKNIAKGARDTFRKSI